jgi:hypothetical protein
MGFPKKHGGRTRWGLSSSAGKTMHLYTEAEIRDRDGRVIWDGWQAKCGDTISDHDPIVFNNPAKYHRCKRCQKKEG